MKKKLLALCSLLLVLTLAVSSVPALASTEINWVKKELKVEFDRYEMQEYYFETPDFSAGGEMAGCVPAAGGNILGYYDKQFPWVVPEYQGKIVNGKETFLSYTDASKVIADLHVRMKTDASGTTTVNFKKGLRDYGLAKGYTVSYSDVGYDGEFWYDYYKEEILAGRPVALFCTNYNVGYMYLFEGYSHSFLSYAATRHSMVGRGFREIVYYKTVNGVEVNFRNDIYLYVESGFPSKGEFMLMDSSVQIEYATAVKIKKN